MTAPFDIDPKNESWTEVEMKLRKKGGWSKQYSAALAGNEGFNRWWHNRLTSAFAVGSNPAPLLDGPNVSGGIMMLWQGFSTTTPALIDSSIDWRDRKLWYHGSIAGDTPNPHTFYVPPGAPLDVEGVTWWDKQNAKFLFEDPGGLGYIGHTWGDVWTGPGNDTLSAFVMLLSTEDAGGTLSTIRIGAKTNGELHGKLAGAETYGSVLSGILLYTAQSGFRDS